MDVDDQVIAAVVGGVAGFLTGAVASVVAPWVNWGIEKRRLRLQRRRELIGEWRDGLADAEVNGLFGGGGSYEHLSWYQSLRPHLRGPGKGRRWVEKRLKPIWYQIRGKSLPKPSPPFSQTIVISEAGGARPGEAVRIARQIEHQAKKWRLE